jgi:hypothetical protein
MEMLDNKEIMREHSSLETEKRSRVINQNSDPPAKPKFRLNKQAVRGAAHTPASENNDKLKRPGEKMLGRCFKHLA